MTARITFLGGTESVTGANFLLDTGAKKFLIDCGLEQGSDFCSGTNYEPFSYDAKTIDALLVTHSHIDHIGRIPKLIRDGFAGPIFSTPATKDLAAVMLEDAVGLMAQEAERCGRETLYTMTHVEQVLAQWQTLEYHSPLDLGDGVVASFHDAGHILGSAMIFLEKNGRRLVFTGDLGNSPDVLLPDTESIKGSHFLVMESVYGDRNHEEKEERTELLEALLRRTYETKGTLLIPSFSLQRTQVLLAEINHMMEDGTLPTFPVFLDSPLAIRVSEIYRAYTNLYNGASRERIQKGDDIFAFPSLVRTIRSQDAEQIARTEGPKVIIAGSGMSHGGRIRKHEIAFLGDRNATILFVGYQTAGSLGRRIKDGAKKVEIDGTWVKVRALVTSLSGYSSHKDLDNLVSFVEGAQETLEQVFVAMGEPKSSLFLTQRLRDYLGVNARAPQKAEIIAIDW